MALGLSAVWHAEIATGPSDVLAKRFQGIPNFGDITAVNWKHRNIIRPGVLVAGFPCQASSVAGRRKGRADARWLWPEVARAIRELNHGDHQIGEIVIENVPNLLRIDGGEAWWDVIGDLADLGYAVRWTVVGACAVGLAHHRHRLFARALPASRTRRPELRRWPPTGVLIDGEVIDLPAPRCGGKRPLFPTPTARDGGGRGEGSPKFWRAKIERTGRTKGIPLGAVLRLLSDDEHFGIYAEAVARHVATTGTLPPAPTEPNRNGAPRLAAVFAEWLMNLPAGHVTDILDRNPALTAIGNGVAPRQARAAYGILCDPL